MPHPPPPPGLPPREACAWQPFFCDANVWRLLTDGGLPEPGAAVFLTNRERRVAMWGQRAAAVDPIVWDYHVVGLLPRARLVLDLDDRTAFARPLAAWLAHAFRPAAPPSPAPRFRVVPLAQLLATFSSDRSHMRDAAGVALQPFPPWPAPFRAELGHTLPRFLDPDDRIAGVVTDRDGLLRLPPT